MPHLLEVTEIEKQFEHVRAVDRLTFHVGGGEIFALLGPNGAGKTTVVRMLLRILTPDRGAIRFFLNCVAREQALPQEIGYLPEERGLYREIAVLKNLSYMGILRGMPREAARLAAEEWLERLDLRERKNERLDQLSKGNQQKVQFIAAILHRPAFAILDEPFSGLDPVNQESFLDLIRELRAAGMTILLSAHQMDLVQRLADRVLLLHRGRAVLEGTITEVRASAAALKKVVVQIEGDVEAALFERFATVAQIDKLTEGTYAFSLRPEAAMSCFLAEAAQLPISGIHSQDPSLHEIFLRTVNDDSGIRPRPLEEGA